ncbi:4-coumarate--CoA ligase [Forsythia ovata]|uniref:4-coumarate--CoA ligase n=1 Tax=Forsythia ovata TaxID=205694 RepID=A0ABD1UY39_9LAMI
MAEYQYSNVYPRSGYCPQTKIFHSLRPPVPLPPPSQPLSIISYTLSLIHSPTSTVSTTLSTTSFLIDAATGSLVYTRFTHFHLLYDRSFFPKATSCLYSPRLLYMFRYCISPFFTRSHRFAG